jgi:hypothetical protein
MKIEIDTDLIVHSFLNSLVRILILFFAVIGVISMTIVGVHFASGDTAISFTHPNELQTPMITCRVVPYTESIKPVSTPVSVDMSKMLYVNSVPNDQLIRPDNITFVVLSTTMNGDYQVTTTDGKLLYMNDYETWNKMLPKSKYKANIIGYKDESYLIGNDIQLIQPGKDYYQIQPDYPIDIRVDDTYPKYYHWKNAYYSYNGKRTDKVDWNRIKFIPLSKTIEGKPPGYGVW